MNVNKEGIVFRAAISSLVGMMIYGITALMIADCLLEVLMNVMNSLLDYGTSFPAVAMSIDPSVFAGCVWLRKIS